MQLPLQITFRGMEKSPWIENIVRQRAEKLEKFCRPITRCNVLIDMPHRHHHQGNFYSVRIDLTVPGKEIVVNREPKSHESYEDIHSVLKDSFETAQRQLEEYARIRRGNVKLHKPGRRKTTTTIETGAEAELEEAEGESTAKANY